MKVQGLRRIIRVDDEAIKVVGISSLAHAQNTSRGGGKIIAIRIPAKKSLRRCKEILNAVHGKAKLDDVVVSSRRQVRNKEWIFVTHRALKLRPNG